VSLDLHNVATQDEEILYKFNQLQSLMASLDPDQISDPSMILLVSQMQREIISTIEDTTGRILLLIQEQNSTSKFYDHRHRHGLLSEQ